MGRSGSSSSSRYHDKQTLLRPSIENTGTGRKRKAPSVQKKEEEKETAAQAHSGAAAPSPALLRSSVPAHALVTVPGTPPAVSAEAAAAAPPMVAEVAAPIAVVISAAKSEEDEVLVVDSPAAVVAVDVGDVGVAAAPTGGSVGEEAEGGTDRMLSLRTSLENWFRKDEVPLESGQVEQQN